MTFELNPSATLDQVNEAARNPLDLSEGPGFFTGMLSAPLDALEGVAAKSARTVNLAASNIPIGLDALTGGTKAQDWWFENMVGEKSGLAEMAAPDPTAGFGAQVLRSFFEIGGQALTMGPVATGVNEGINSALQSVDQGVDATTALTKGAIEGTAIGLGVALPMSLGLRTMDDLAYAAAANAVPNAASRLLVSETLKAGGYADMAQQYQWLDAQAIAADVVLGVAFGAVGRFMQSRNVNARATVKPSQVDAALATNKARHAEIDTAPGIPADVIARDAHAAALVKSTEDLIAGRPVELGNALDEANFIPKPQDAVVHAEFEAAAKEYEVDGARQYVDLRGNAFDFPGEAYEKAADDIVAMLDDMGFETRRESSRVSMSEYVYAKTPDYAESEIGEVLRGGEIKFRFSNHELPRHHEQADFDVAAFDADLSRPDIGGDVVDALRFAIKRAGIQPSGQAKTLIDARVAELDSAIKAEAERRTQVEASRTAVARQAYDFVARQPEDAIIGVSKRGRMTSTVNGKIIDAIDTFPREWASGTQVAKGKAPKKTKAEALVFLESEEGAPTPDHGKLGLRASANAEMQERPVVRAGESGSPGGPARSGSGAGSEATLSEKFATDKSAADHPEIQAANEILARRPDLALVTEDGEAIPAQKALAQADEEIAKVKHESRAFAAAVACFLRG